MSYYRLLYRGIREAILWELLASPMPKRMARKAGIRTGAAGGGPNIGGSFTLINDATGYTASRGGVEEFFPADGLSMERLLDLEGFTLARLLVTITEAHATGSEIGVKSDEAFGDGLFVSADAVGVIISEWTPLTKTQDAVRSRFYVRNPSESAGSYAVGLCQLQFA